ncbi:MAG: thioesterase family protein [Candidatus Nanopelagicales bacterium]|nr:acyl-CoA thioesterase [Candidatus Nanopelagicales bacterium]
MSEPTVRRTLATMRWSDMDALGHVHNIKMLEYYEAARAELIHEVLDLGAPADIGLVVRHHDIDYLAPLVYRSSPIAVDMVVDRIGSTSFSLSYTVTEPDNSVIYSRASTVIVAIEKTTGKPKQLPEFLRGHLRRYLQLKAS